MSTRDPNFRVTLDWQRTAAQEHWQRVYDRREPGEMSWYEPAAEMSLALIQEAQLPADAAIIDAGGGTSELAGQLLEAGYTDITLADISPQARQQAQLELTNSARVHWVQADLRSHDFDRRYKLWHDRAVFHFMVDPPTESTISPPYSPAST